MMSEVLLSLIRFLLLVLILATGTLSAASPKAEKIQQYIEEAFSYQTDGATPAELKKALALYSSVLKLDAGNFHALFNAADICSKTDRNKKAQDLFTRAVRSAQKRHKNTPEYLARALNGLGICYQRSGKIQQALKLFRQAKQQHRPLVKAHYNLINLLILEGQADEIESALAEAEEVAPSPLYVKLRSKLKGKEGSELLSGYSLKVIGFALGGGILLILFLKNIRTKNGSTVTLKSNKSRDKPRSSRSTNRGS